MHTVKLTQIDDSLGVILPNAEPLILPNEVLAQFKPKIGDTVLVVKSADRYRISFNTIKPGGTVLIIKGTDGYSISAHDKSRRFRSMKLKCPHSRAAIRLRINPSRKNLAKSKPRQGEAMLPLGNTNNGTPDIAEQLELGREFMREFHETFQALAK